MNEAIIAAKRRIQDIRRKQLDVVVMSAGKAVPDATVTLRMKKHQFLFGANCFAVNAFDAEEKNNAYSDRFTELLNYATLPFYWGGYEPKPGVLDQPHLESLVRWCKTHGLLCKGHPLVWHEVVPEWVTANDDIDTLIRKRIHEIMSVFGDAVDFWDLFNELCNIERFSNVMVDWVYKKGKANAVQFAMDCVREISPRANLLYNETEIQVPDMELLLRQFRDRGMRFAAIGLQSHMHERRWSLEETWDILQRYEKFGWPLHFTEVSILSGRPAGGRVYYGADAGKNVWLMQPGDEDEQAAFAADFYTLVFSHPAVEAITWWDLTEGSWLGAPSGILSKELTPKPAYRALMNLIKREWWSDYSGRTNIEGVASAKLFCGTYDATVESCGKEVSIEFDLTRDHNTNSRQKIIVCI